MTSTTSSSRGLALATIAATAALLAVVLAASLSAAGKPQKAVPRGSSGGGQSSGGSGQSSGGSQESKPAPQGARPPSGGSSSGGGVTTTGSTSGSGRASSGSPATSPQGGDRAVPYGRPRDGRITGEAAVRTSPPSRPGPDVIYVNPYGYYPWGYGGYGFGGYYGGYYDGYGYGSGYRDYSMGYIGDGALKIKIKPSDAQVFVDGYYAGVVDDFDGLFQSLHVEPGPHRIEVRADGFEPLYFDVRIARERTITYTGELRQQ